MSDSNQNKTGWKLHTDRVYRQWTEEEVLKAVDYTKKNYPHIWQKLIEEELEPTDDIFHQSEARAIMGCVVLSKLHPESNSVDIGKLFSLVYTVLCNEIEKDQSNG